jgi:hypothetical protein
MAQELRELQAIALPARESADGRLLDRAAEQEARQVVANGQRLVAVHDHVRAVRDLLVDREVVAQGLPRLIDVTEMGRLAELDRSRIRLLAADDHVDEGRLAEAVRTGDADDRPGRHVEVEIAQQDLVSVRLVHAPHRDDLAAESRAEGDAQLELLGGLDLARLLDEVFVGRDAGLRLRPPRLGRRADPLELARDRLQQVRVGPILDLLLLLLRFEEVGVVALVGAHRALGHFQHARRDAIEEIAIVGHEHVGARVSGEEGLEPGDRVGVEMVRRLVEDQDVGMGEQLLAERDAAALAAGERAHDAVAGREPERVHRRFDAGVEGGGIHRVAVLESLLDLALLGEQRVGLLLVGEDLGILPGLQDPVVAREQRPDLPDRLFDVLAHRLVEVELRLLRDVADGRALRDHELAVVLAVAARDDAHHRRLADAVDAEDADAIAGREAERRAGQDRAIAEAAPEILRHQDRLPRIESLHRISFISAGSTGRPSATAPGSRSRRRPSTTPDGARSARARPASSAGAPRRSAASR